MSQDQARKEDVFAPYLRGQYSESFAGLSELAEQGDVDALIAVGWMRECGVGAERDINKALECYKSAAEAGSLDATYRLGLLLVSEGEREEAKSIFESGAKEGNISCMLQLGISLLESPDDDEVDRGWSLIKRAADHGNIFAKRKWWSFQWKICNSIFARSKLLIGLIPLFWVGVREIVRDPNSEKVF